jgi:hypothetical protein
MKIYWSIKSIPEFVGLPKKERSRIWRRCHWRALKGSWGPWAGLITIAAFSSWGSLLHESWGGIIGIALGGFIFFQVMMEAVQPYVREELQQSKMQKKDETLQPDTPNH